LVNLSEAVARIQFIADVSLVAPCKKDKLKMALSMISEMTGTIDTAFSRCHFPPREMIPAHQLPCPQPPFRWLYMLQSIACVCMITHDPDGIAARQSARCWRGFVWCMHLHEKRCIKRAGVAVKALRVIAINRLEYVL